MHVIRVRVDAIEIMDWLYKNGEVQLWGPEERSALKTPLEVDKI